MSTRPANTLRFTLLALALGAALGAAPAARAADVSLSVHVIRAAGQPTEGQAPVVDAELKGIPVTKLGLAYARYELDRIARETAAWGDAVLVAFGEGGRLVLTPSPGTEERPVSLHVELTLPDADKPCLTTDIVVAADQGQLQFCRAEVAGVQWLFWFSARPGA